MRRPKKTPAAAVEEPLVGHLDDCDWHTFWGWACNPADPDTAVWLEAVVDDQEPVRLLANRHRPDLASAGFGRGWVGFHLHFPAPLDPRKPHTVIVRRASDGQQLPKSPWHLPAAPAGGPAARREFEASISAEIEATRSSVELLPMTEFLVRQTDRLLQMAADIDNGRQARALFKTRWAETLGGTPLEVASPDVRPMVLVVGADLPQDGALKGLIKGLQALDMRVAVVAVRGLPMQGEAADALRQDGVIVMGAPLYFTVEDVLARNVGMFRVIILQGPVIAAAYAVAARLRHPGARILAVLDEANAEPKFVIAAQMLTDGAITGSAETEKALLERVRGMPITVIPATSRPRKLADLLRVAIQPPQRTQTPA